MFFKPEAMPLIGPVETVAAILEALLRNLHFAHKPRNTLRVGIYRYKYSRPRSRVHVSGSRASFHAL